MASIGHFAAQWFGAAQFDPMRRQLDPAPQFRKSSSQAIKNARQLRHLASSSAQRAVSAVSPAGEVASGSAQAPQLVGAAESTSTEPRLKASEEKSYAAGIAAFLDKDGDGDFDLHDLHAHLKSEVVGEAEEDMQRQYPPVFILCQSVLALGLWITFAAKDQPNNFFNARAGLDSIFPGSTDMILHTDCTDHRPQVYRWLSYQLTHGNFSHVAMNVFLILMTGIPLEGFHGTLRICLIFNLGVIGGAMFFALSDGHGSLVGMSAGCYALIGMHLGDLFLNWSQIRYRKPKLIFMLLLIGIDLANIQLSMAAGYQGGTSHSAHAGGYVVGFILGVLLGRNLEVNWWERCVQIGLVVLAIGLTVFGAVWIAQWPPRTIWDTTPWCWARQAYNESLFGDIGFHCVRCQDENCIKTFSLMEYVDNVNFRMCDLLYGWDYSQ